MKCEEARLGISDRLDGALGPDDAPALELHVSTCAACRAEEGAFAVLDEAMRSSRPPEVPSRLGERLARGLWRTPARVVPIGRWALATAAAILVAALTLYSFSLGLRGKSAPPAPSPREEPRPDEGPVGTADSPVPGTQSVRATGGRGQVRVDATAFEALEVLRERVARSPARGGVLDALDRTGLFLEEVAAASETDSPDLGAVKEEIAVAGVIRIVGDLAGEFDRAGDAAGSEAARDLLAALRSVVDAK
ncbi:MAG TPA: zf-HC2 domain-containing protein [Planctomycetota bacterium]|nr:zf-HC2 domain-containing protein [Planctomycetota bacterium]